MKYVNEFCDRAAAALVGGLRGGSLVADHQSVRMCLYCRMRVSSVSTVVFSSLAVATMI